MRADEAPSSLALPATTLPAAAVPVRIHAVALTNFRAFPGPAPARFELAGKNLLLYGENGAGKSSLFHALSNFFPKNHRSCSSTTMFSQVTLLLIARLLLN